MSSDSETTEDIDATNDATAQDIPVEVTPPDADTVEGDLQEVTPEAYAELDNRLLRLQADFENFRKRTVRERSEMSRTANEGILNELLTVIDHLEIALDAAVAYDADKAFMEGFQMVSSQMMTALGKFGLTPINTEGCEFDPNIHEAICHQASEDIAEDHVVLCTRKGFMLGERLLRAAQVIVSSGPGE